MKSLKKIASLILALVMCMSLCVPAFADEKIEFTAKELQEIFATNKKIDDFMCSQGITRAGDGVVLNMTPIRQINGSYCGPAACCMVTTTLGLGSYSQEQMAQLLGTTSEGSSSFMIATVLSDLLKKNGISDKYQVTQTDVSDLIGTAVYSLEHGYPVVVNVKEMPNYVVSSGHFIVIHGYYAAAQAGSSGISNFYVCDSHPTHWGASVFPMQAIVNGCNTSRGKNFVRLA